jgi:ABC-type Fe3+/spermidine/putrescine transport system ATPase subunit
MSDVIRLGDVTLEVCGRPLLSGISLHVSEGEILALLGPSGAGKTSLVRLVLGFLAPARGELRLRDRVASKDGKVLIPPEERGLAVVFQDLALWPHLTVRGNLEFGLKARGIERVARDARIAGWLRRLGMEDKEHRYPGSLSGGERQRVALARAFVLEPLALLLDEPLASLDIVLKRELLSLLRELLRESRATALYVSHDPREAAVLADRVAVLENGVIVQHGTFDRLRKAPVTKFVGDLLAEFPPDGNPADRTLHPSGPGA